MVTIGDQTEWINKKLEWKRYEYPLKEEDTVLDLGSYRREFADLIIKMYGSTVICFDALDNNAAWIKDGTLLMGGQYYYTSAFENEGDKREYRCVDIKPYLQKEIALVKINVEGGEYELLQHIIEHGLHTNIKFLQVQFHKIDGVDTDILYQIIADELSETHKLQWRYPYVWESWEMV